MANNKQLYSPMVWYPNNYKLEGTSIYLIESAYNDTYHDMMKILKYIPEEPSFAYFRSGDRKVVITNETDYILITYKDNTIIKEN